MARIARIVVPGIPHHVTQRGNRRQDVFFSDNDRTFYLNLLHAHAKQCGLKIWAYCLMDNHIHVIVVPQHEDALADGFSEVHQRYTRMINFREKWRGYLWEGRFKSCPLSEQHLYAAIRYVENNPVRAKIVKHAWLYPWSSAQAHALKKPNTLIESCFITDDIKDWKAYLSDSKEDKGLIKRLVSNSNTGRPLGDEVFIKHLEKITGRTLRKQKPGPRENEKSNN
ncbi:MAG: transposase [Candidatus Omnitrophica bacterium]|nr:transposase [Candidatus Omnitrophota bacterium]